MHRGASERHDVSRSVLDACGSENRLIAVLCLLKWTEVGGICSGRLTAHASGKRQTELSLFNDHPSFSHTRVGTHPRSGSARGCYIDLVDRDQRWLLCGTGGRFATGQIPEALSLWPARGGMV